MLLMKEKRKPLSLIVVVVNFSTICFFKFSNSPLENRLIQEVYLKAKMCYAEAAIFT